MHIRFLKRKLASCLLTAFCATVLLCNTVFAGNVVVVLDPGHDSTHAGTQAGGFGEENLNLQVAKYCKEELEKYTGVTVYMTREDVGCPYPGTKAGDDNYKRVQFASQVGADAYVALHFNYAANPSAKGVNVYYPNGNYNPVVGANGKNLAAKIQERIVALGLNDRGIVVRNSEDNTLYPDGSLADYYAVIKNSKLNGFAGIIIEHAFLSNASDAAFLSIPNNIKRLGMADAAGIAAYFGLQLKSEQSNVFYYGDVNLDNAVNAEDALAILRYAVKLETIDDEIALHLADADKDGEIAAADALKVLRITVSLEQREVWNP